MLTPGQYYFVPEDTPFYDDWHVLWSRDWVSEEAPADPPLGEQAGHARWYSGGPPPFPVIEERLGTEDCCGFGGHYPRDLLPEADVFEGFPLDCLRVEHTGPIDVPQPDFCDREEMIREIIILEKIRTGSPGVPDDIHAYLGAAAVVSYHPPDGSAVPATAIADLPKFTVVFIVGTSTADQFWGQVIFSTVGPNQTTGLPDIGPWWDSTMTIERRITAAIGVQPIKPIVLIGHSYGGVIATMLGVRFARGSEDRLVNVVGFGTPKCVAGFVMEQNKRRGWCYIANMGDPVPSLPPTVLQLGPLVLGIPLPVKFLWSTWYKPGNQWILYEDGRLVSDQGATFYFWELQQIIADYLAGVPIRNFTDHEIVTYLSRLEGPPP